MSWLTGLAIESSAPAQPDVTFCDLPGPAHSISTVCRAKHAVVFKVAPTASHVVSV